MRKTHAYVRMHTCVCVNALYVRNKKNEFEIFSSLSEQLHVLRTISKVEIEIK